MRERLALVMTVLAVQGLALLALRFVHDSWYLYLLNSIQLQAALALMLFGIVIFIIHRGWPGALVTFAAFGLTAHAWLSLGAHSAAPSPAAKPLLKVISFNILGNNSKNGPAIADMLVGSGADVLFLQESAAIGPVIPKIRAAYPYRLGCGALTMTCDNSLWSKRPLIDGEVKTISPLYRDRYMAASIDVDGTLVRLVNVHLAKPYFDETHAVELKKLADAVNATTGPLVLAGDFNASVLAPDVDRFLEKTGLKTARREPATWPVEAIWAGVAIDHMFTRQPAVIRVIRRMEKTYGSNHFGLVAQVSIEKN